MLFRNVIAWYPNVTWQISEKIQQWNVFTKKHNKIGYKTNIRKQENIL